MVAQHSSGSLPSNSSIRATLARRTAAKRREIAQELAQATGSYHIDPNMDLVIEASTALFASPFSRT